MSDVIAERYELLERLGRGGMGEVWKALDLTLRREVAVKLVALTGEDPTVRARFEREAVTMAGITHPNVATIFDAGTDEHGERAYLVMELLGGGDLRQRLRDNGPMPWSEIRQIGSGVAAGLAAAHANGVIHRDVKPANIMFEGNTPKVLDFGIARLSEAAADGLTQTSMTIGTAAYISPEQAKGQKVTPASDAYAMGCLLYAMATGTPPFTAENQIAVVRAQVYDTPPRLSEVRADTPPDIDDLVARLLAKDPDDRPDLNQVAAVLDGAQLSTVPAAVLPEDVTTRLIPPVAAGATLAPTTPHVEDNVLVPPVSPEEDDRRKNLTAPIIMTLMALVIAVGAYFAIAQPFGDKKPQRGVTGNPTPSVTHESTTAPPSTPPPSSTPQATPTASATPSPSQTPTPTPTPSPTTTVTKTETATPTPSPESTPPSSLPATTQTMASSVPPTEPSNTDNATSANQAVSSSIVAVADPTASNDLLKEWEAVMTAQQQGNTDQRDNSFNNLKKMIDDREKSGQITKDEAEKIREALDVADDYF